MKKKSDGSNVIYNSQNLICYSSYFSLKQHGTIHLNISKSSSRSWRQLTYFHLSLPFSQWNKSATWSTLCRKWVPGTTSPQQPPSEKPSFANVTNEKKRGRKLGQPCRCRIHKCRIVSTGCFRAQWFEWAVRAL